MTKLEVWWVVFLPYVMGTASPAPGHLLDAVRMRTLCTVENQFQTHPEWLKHSDSHSFIAWTGLLAWDQLLPCFFGLAGRCLGVTDGNSHAGITTSWWEAYWSVMKRLSAPSRTAWWRRLGPTWQASSTCCRQITAPKATRARTSPGDVSPSRRS